MNSNIIVFNFLKKEVLFCVFPFAPYSCIIVARKEVMGHDIIGTVCTAGRSSSRAGRDATNFSGDCQRNCKTYFL